jgi:hypothetical protein
MVRFCMRGLSRYFPIVARGGTEPLSTGGNLGEGALAVPYTISIHRLPYCAGRVMMESDRLWPHCFGHGLTLDLGGMNR